LLASGLLALIHFTLLASTPGSLKKVIGAFVGQPSIWPYFRISKFSEVAALLAAGTVLWSLWSVAKRRRVPDYALLGLFGVWIPMFFIGFFMWSMPPRYTVASLLPLMLCGFAFAQKGGEWLQAKLTSASGRPWHQGWQIAAAAVTATLVVNPVAVAGTVNSGYESHPDHKGAAEFMRSQHLVAADVILAEDVLQQTYYLGSGTVDYWLMSRHHARRYVELVDGQIRDFYTGAGVISDATLLQQLLQRERGQRIFVIGSGENQSDHRKGMRGDMDPVLRSTQFQVVYEGRDGLTKVWLATGARPESTPPSPPPHQE
ncbi:MAG: hypothetical protein ABW171_01105, partial [Steroidobacter sp.]